MPPVVPSTPAIAKSDFVPPGPITFDVSAIFFFDGFGGFSLTVAVTSPEVAPVFVKARTQSPPDASVCFEDAPVRTTSGAFGTVSDTRAPVAAEPFAGLTESVAAAPASALKFSDDAAAGARVAVAVALVGLFHETEIE